MSSPPPTSWCVISTEKKFLIYLSKGVDIFQLSLDKEPQIMVLN